MSEPRPPTTSELSDLIRYVQTQIMHDWHYLLADYEITTWCIAVFDNAYNMLKYSGKVMIATDNDGITRILHWDENGTLLSLP